MIAPRHHSLRRRLLVLLLVVTVAYWAAVAGLTVVDTIDETAEIFDVNLARAGIALLHVADPDEITPFPLPDDRAPDTADNLAKTLPDLGARLAGKRAIRETGPGTRPTSDTPDARAARFTASDYERKMRYQVWSVDGRLLLRSPLAPTAPIADRDGYSDTRDTDGSTWRNFSVWDQHHAYRVVVSEARDLRQLLLSDLVVHIGAPLLLGLPVLVLLLWLAIRRAVGSLGDIAREIGERKPETLTPLDVNTVPEEVRPMAQALNGLMGRVGQTLDNERRFTSNAAHELRTPLAAIQAHLHAARNAHTDAERQHGLEQAQRGVDRGIRMVGQLLTLARLDPEHSVPDAARVDIGELVETTSADLAPGALQKDQTIECRVDPDLPPVEGNADMLGMLISNLIDNAIRYTPYGGRIGIAVRGARDGVVVDVVDDGPGIAPDQRARVFERFYRLADQNQPGTGLGLAICKRIADLHRARIDLRDGAHGVGLAASVFMPAQVAA